MNYILPVTIFICAILLISLIFLVRYTIHLRRVLLSAEGDFIMAKFHLALLKKLEEKDYDTVKDGLAMHTRHYVYNWRMHEKKLPASKISEIRKRQAGSELIDNAEQLCGPLE